MYAQPFMFDIEPGVPLLVMSCSTACTERT